MIRIVCTKCKNAYLQNKDDSLVCPSCEAVFSTEEENLLLGVQYYNEGNFSEADNCLMKYIVKNGAEPKAIIYKALCDGYSFDEDTVSLKDTYSKILEALGDISDDELPVFIAIANDEAKKLEVALTDSHIRLFADADAEKIKKQVATVLDIQKEARGFRSSLTDIVNDFNSRNAIQLSVKFSDCFFVSSDIATEVGDIKYQKICDNIAAHTVFTGILSNDIKNLEIYYRCIVMFFEKSHDKYEFLLKESAKFTELAEILEQGQYNTIKGTAAIGTKLKSISYEFLEESYKEHFDENINMQKETVVIIEPEVEVIEEATEENIEDVSSAEVVEASDEETEIVEAESVEDSESSDEADAIDATDDATDDAVVEIAEEAVVDTVDEATETIVKNEVSEEVSEEIAEEIENVATVEEADVTDETDDVLTVEADETANTVIDIDADDEATEEAEETVEAVEESVTEEASEAVVEEAIVETSDEANESASENEEKEEATEKSEEFTVDSSNIIEADIPETEPENEQPKKKKKSHKGLLVILLIIVIIGAVVGFKYVPGYINDYKYNNAVALFESGKYDAAAAVFAEIDDYKDSKEKQNECIYNKAAKLEEEKKFGEAITVYKSLGIYKDCGIRIQSCTYFQAKQEMDNGNYDKAVELFKTIVDYGDSSSMINECTYRVALKHIENKEVTEAIELLNSIIDYSDAQEKINEAKYVYVTENFDAQNETTVAYLNELTLAKYRNSEELRTQLLGSATVTSDKIKAFVNYSTTDMETALTELDNGKTCYFHVVVEDEALYGQRLSIKYRTAFGYTQSKSVYFSAEENSSYVSYPPTKFKNYEVTFQLVDADGNVLAEQVITF